MNGSTSSLPSSHAETRESSGAVHSLRLHTERRTSGTWCPTTDMAPRLLVALLCAALPGYFTQDDGHLNCKFICCLLFQQSSISRRGFLINTRRKGQICCKRLQLSKSSEDISPATLADSVAAFSYIAQRAADLLP